MSHISCAKANFLSSNSNTCLVCVRTYPKCTPRHRVIQQSWRTDNLICFCRCPQNVRHVTHPQACTFPRPRILPTNTTSALHRLPPHCPLELPLSAAEPTQHQQGHQSYCSGHQLHLSEPLFRPTIACWRCQISEPPKLPTSRCHDRCPGNRRYSCISSSMVV